MVNREFLSIVAKLSESSNILVVGHIMPDGDDISSVLSAKIGLERLGKNVLAGIDWRIPWYFYEFEEVNQILTYEQVKERGFRPEVVLIVDASSPDRVGQFQEFLIQQPYYSWTTMLPTHFLVTTIGSIRNLDQLHRWS